MLRTRATDHNMWLVAFLLTKNMNGGKNIENNSKRHQGTEQTLKT